jgi:hypothetical protein
LLVRRDGSKRAFHAHVSRLVFDAVGGLSDSADNAQVDSVRAR